LLLQLLALLLEQHQLLVVQALQCNWCLRGLCTSRVLLLLLLLDVCKPLLAAAVGT
jgi:hypothetical protein